VPARPIAASLVEQALPDIFPDSMRPIEPDRIGLLDFKNAEAPLALDSEQMARDFREAALLDRKWRPSSGAPIGQDCLP